MSGQVNATWIAKLFDQYGSALEIYAAQRTAAPEDCVQEAFIELARQTAWPANPAAWLFRVVRNRALNSTRADRRRVVHEKTASHRRNVSDGEPDPQETVAIADLLGTLGDAEREIVIMKIWGRLTWQEIADVMGRSRSSTQRDYVQALSRLRVLLESSVCQETKSN